MHARRLRATAVVLLAAGLAALILSVGAGAVSSQKPYSIVMCGSDQTGCTPSNATPNITAVVAPGATTTTTPPGATMSVTFTNENQGSGITLGSDNLTVPSTPTGLSPIFSVINTRAPVATSLPPCATPLPQQGPPCFYVLDRNGNPVTNPLDTGPTLGLRDLNLAPGATITVSFLVTTPSLPTPPQTPTFCTNASPCQWSDLSKQSNDFSGTGNALNPDLKTSNYGTVTSTVASCPKNNGCTTKLGNGGTATSAGGSISTTVSTKSGKTTVTQVEAIDFGPPLSQDPTTTNHPCSGVTSPHLTSETLANGADNGADRSQTITINTTHFPGYVAQACFETNTQFTQLILAADGKTPLALAPADPTTLPDGTRGFVGLLPDCATSPSQPLQVSCNKNPGVLQRQTVGTVHTLVASIPPGFDSRIGN